MEGHRKGRKFKVDPLPAKEIPITEGASSSATPAKTAIQDWKLRKILRKLPVVYQAKSQNSVVVGGDGLPKTVSSSVASRALSPTSPKRVNKSVFKRRCAAG
eukprot:Gregarina_sp_Poly_1__1752@NODE_1452_length_4120_cov_155_009869_g963_i0_p5_GENE_NODE_1452_length_4120_cov_155_009869_g963_i0NODE_1452_length_4120_cov_155_009869_g963_i0_p5_ORF_typecomplete_len102_score12_00_NODE_1452_length_4120_cov_155_009869_g963_i08381143